MTNEEIVSKSKEILDANTEWISRYSGYAEKIMLNQSKIKNAREKFYNLEPFSVYSCVSKAKDSNPDVAFDLRFCGQSVATLTVEDDEVYISTKDNNKNYFTLSDGHFPEIFKDLWVSDKARKFKKFFIANEKELETKILSPEHKLENKLLKMFKSKRKNNIEPVEIPGGFFQMPTPFKGSVKDTVEYANSNGGGIDILARITHGGNRDNRLAVMELKDENKPSEPQKDVIQQALKYATFIACLLRSESGAKWYGLFGKDGPVPDNLKIDVVSVMPKGNSDIIKDGEQITIDDLNVTLCLYSMFFEPEGENLNFDGTLAKVLTK